MGYPPVVVVESGGVPRTQVAEGASAPPATVSTGGRPITLADNAPPIALFNDDGSTYGTDLLGGDGAFLASTNWTLSGTAAVASDRLTMTSAGRASHSVAIPAGGGVFKVTVTIIARTAGDVTFNFANDDAGTNGGTSVFASRTPGTYELTVTALAGNDVFRVNGVSAYAGSITDLTVSRLT